MRVSGGSGLNSSNPVHFMPAEDYFTLIRSMLDETGQASVRVTGISMRPLLENLRDSVIIIKPEHLHIGDIVLFDRLNGRYALHRVIRKRKDGFTMAGDNQWFVERKLPYDQITGVVTSINRKGRIISCRKLSMQIYAQVVVLLTMPRIYLYRLAKRTYRFIRIIGPHAGKGKTDGHQT